MPRKILISRLFSQLEYDLKLNLIAGKNGLDKKIITVSEVNRPGLSLCGYYEGFAYDRIQVMGAGEIGYLETLTPEERKEIFERMLSYDIPCFVVTRGLKSPQELIDECEKTSTPLITTMLETPAFVARLVPRLEDEFGPTQLMPGNFVEAFGIGVLILGESGIGKSECALELIRRGHRLIADDVVYLKRVTGHRVLGSNVYPFGHFMEVRGVGVIDISALFGITAVRARKTIDMVVTLEHWNETSDYDRLGLEEKTYNILGEELPHVIIPVQPGRNTSITVEVAAMNLRAKKMGRHSARELNESLKLRMQSGERDFGFGEFDD